MELTQLAALHGGEILREMLRNIAARVKSPIARSTPIVVFNPLSWKRDDVVKTHASRGIPSRQDVPEDSPAIIWKRTGED